VYAVDCKLHHVARAIGANPHHPVTCLLLSEEDADDVAGPEISVEPPYQGASEADIESFGFLQETFPRGVDAPDQDLKVGDPA
jgi:hypothetical protein